MTRQTSRLLVTDNAVSPTDELTNAFARNARRAELPYHALARRQRQRASLSPVTEASTRDSLRQRFNEDAENYNRARPSYPAELFDDLVQLAGLGPGARILEIGCGTGQATAPLARRGFTIVAVELGEALADVARRNLAEFPAVQVINAPFEQWPLPAEPFDLVLSATAFHWIDPAIRVTKSADALRPSGSLAIITTHHIGGGPTASFFNDMQRCYEQWDPTTPSSLKIPTAADIPTDTTELDNSGRFEPTVVRRYEWQQQYSAKTYIQLLETYSDQRARPPESGAELLKCIERLIDTSYNGSIQKPYMNELQLARRRR